MIVKTKSSKLRNIFGYIFGGDPQDEWTFEIDGFPCRFSNGWRSGASLYLDKEEVDRNSKLFALDGKKPLLSGKLKKKDGTESTISIHVKAVTGIKIQIRRNDEPIHDGFI